jgi:hypothetical protein
MTPYEIEVMLWYYTRCEDHEDASRNPPVWRPTIVEFLTAGLLELKPVESKRDVCYVLTDRGKAYCEFLCAVQVPVCKWVQPPRADRIAAVLANGREE